MISLSLKGKTTRNTEFRHDEGKDAVGKLVERIGDRVDHSCEGPREMEVHDDPMEYRNTTFPISNNSKDVPFEILYWPILSSDNKGVPAIFR